MPYLDEDMLETAALIAQEVKDEYHRFRDFIAKWRELYGQAPGDLPNIKRYYEAYFGFDQRTGPTHDMETAKRLR